MAERPFPAYQGDAPYIFVSYAHEDADAVYADLEWLNAQGINVWYDEGISPGSRWSDALAAALDGAAHFVYFVTPNSVASQNCLDEVGFALERDKPLLALHLETTELPAGLLLRLGSRQAILKHQLAEDAYRTKLAETLGTYVTAPAGDARPDAEESAGLDSDLPFSSIAILPFENRSDDLDLDTLAEAIHEDVSEGWSARWSGQRMIGASETRLDQYRGQSATAIAASLRVGMLLRGNMRKLGSQVRFLVELVDYDGEQIWIHRFNEPHAEVYDHMDEIVDMIIYNADQHRWTYLQSKARRLDEHQLGPFGLAVRAMADYDMRDDNSRAQSRRLFARAIEIAPREPGFKSMLAFNLANEVMQGFSADPAKDGELASRYAEEVVIGGGAPQALMNAGNTFGFLGDHRRAVALCRRAYEQYPRNRVAKDSLALRLLYSGSPDDALALYDEIMTARLPGQPAPYAFIAQCHVLLGNDADALACAQQAVDENARDPVAASLYANLLALQGRDEEAQQAIAKLREMLPKFKLRASINAYRRVYATDSAREAVTAGLQKLIDRGFE